MPIKALSFDLDDTFWPIAPVIERAERRMQQWIVRRHPDLAPRLDPKVLRELRESVATDHPHLAHDLSAMRRMTLSLAMRPAGCDEKDVESAFQVFWSARNEVQLFPDVRPTLRALHPAYRLVTITNGNADMHRIGLGEVFEHHVKAAQVGVAKPAPAIFEHALAALELAPHEVLHVGDHLEADVAGALRVGMRAVWLNREQRSGGLQQVPVIRSLTELPELLETL
ncbi:MAG: HAD-IA family hydrolase [Pseudomonadota bacterium]